MRSHFQMGFHLSTLHDVQSTYQFIQRANLGENVLWPSNYRLLQAASLIDPVSIRVCRRALNSVSDGEDSTGSHVAFTNAIFTTAENMFAYVSLQAIHGSLDRLI
jgi:hypothetical protein